MNENITRCLIDIRSRVVECYFENEESPNENNHDNIMLTFDSIDILEKTLLENEKQ